MRSLRRGLSHKSRRRLGGPLRRNGFASRGRRKRLQRDSGGRRFRRERRDRLVRHPRRKAAHRLWRRRSNGQRCSRVAESSPWRLCAWAL